MDQKLTWLGIQPGHAYTPDRMGLPMDQKLTWLGIQPLASGSDWIGPHSGQDGAPNGPEINLVGDPAGN